MRALDLTGQRFGRLTACERVPAPKTDGKKNAGWECVCECGERVKARATHLRRQVLDDKAPEAPLP